MGINSTVKYIKDRGISLAKLILKDVTTPAYQLHVKSNSSVALTANRVLTLDVANADRTLAITASGTILSVDPAITALGVDDTDGYALTKGFNVITGGAANTGVELPLAVVGDKCVVANLTGSAKKVYANASDQIDDKTVTTGSVILQPEQVVTFRAYTVAKWQSDYEASATYDVIYVDTIAENTSATGVTIDGVLLKDGMGTFTSAAGGVITIDADTTDHTAGNVVAIDLGVNSASVNALDISADVKTALSGAEVVKGINIDTNALAADADTSAVYGLNITASTVSTSRADIKGAFITIDGTMDTADTMYGIQVDYNANQSAAIEGAGILIDNDTTLNHASATNYGVLVDLRDVINTSSSEIAGFKVRLEDNGKGLVIDAVIVPHSAGNLIDVDADVADIVSGSIKGINLNFDETVVGTDATFIYGTDIAITGFATGRADLVGQRIVFDGSKTGGDSTKGLAINADSLTLNNGSETFTAIEVDASGLTNTSSSSLIGIDVQLPASATAGLQTNGNILCTKNAGTLVQPAAGTIAAQEFGDGKHHITVLTLAAARVGAVAAAALGIGTQLYELPAGVQFFQVSEINLAFDNDNASCDADDPVYGIGSVVASGAVFALNGTGTFMDYFTEQTSTNCDGTTGATAGPKAPTAGFATGIGLNASGSEKSIFLNCAETWTGTTNITATGTITLIWDTLR